MVFYRTTKKFHLTTRGWVEARKYRSSNNRAYPEPPANAVERWTLSIVAEDPKRSEKVTWSGRVVDHSYTDDQRTFFRVSAGRGLPGGYTFPTEVVVMKWGKGVKLNAR